MAHHLFCSISDVTFYIELYGTKITFKVFYGNLYH